VDYGKILRRTWDIIWEHKFLILLGVLIALSGGGGSSVSTGSAGNFDWDARGPQELPPRELPQFPELPELWHDWGIPVLPVVVIVVLVGLALLLGLVVWVVSTIARGGLIAGASAIDAGSPTSFGQAWNAGWRKGWTLLGIGVLPAIPGLFMFLAGLMAAGIALGLGSTFGDQVGVRNAFGLGAVLVALFCVVIPFVVLLNVLRTFANRACMLDNLGVIDAYRRGFQVLIDNIGPALVLFLIQIGIGILLGIVMILPGIIIALCCLLWPLFLLIQGTAAAYFSTLWTLAWREWTAV
jgi:hypothetical protein